MDAMAASGLLAEAGLRIAPGEVRIEARDNRWAAHLPDECMAWFPMNAAGAQYLAREARVLALLAVRRCAFRLHPGFQVSLLGQREHAGTSTFSGCSCRPGRDGRCRHASADQSRLAAAICSSSSSPHAISVCGFANGARSLATQS